MGYSEEDRIEMAKYAAAELRRQKESRIWGGAAVIYILFLVTRYFLHVLETGRLDISSALQVISYNIFSIFVIAYAPSLFYQVFNLYPIEFLRVAIQTKSWPIDIDKVDKPNKQAPDIHDSGTHSKQYIAQQVLIARESHLIAEKIYTRAGAYLFLGCSIAFAGIAVFNTFLASKVENEIIATRFDANAFNAMSSLNKAQDTLSKPVINALRTAIVNKILEKDLVVNRDIYLNFGEKVINYLPRFGALVLIEFVAFFFLKQYMVMLEEYRYYESIKRKRQDALVVSIATDEIKDNETLLKLIVDLYAHSDYHKLTKEETTQMLESQKIISRELDFSSKLIEIINALKPK